MKWVHETLRSLIAMGQRLPNSLLVQHSIITLSTMLLFYTTQHSTIQLVTPQVLCHCRKAFHAPVWIKLIQRYKTSNATPCCKIITKFWRSHENCLISRVTIKEFQTSESSSRIDISKQDPMFKKSCT